MSQHARDRPKILKAIVIGWISHRDRPKILQAIIIGWISHIPACQRQTKDITSNDYWMDQSYHSLPETDQRYYKQ